jgi:C1A family cysteine protease
VLAPYDESDTNVDWRERHVVNPIRDQYDCGSCYAFSTIAAAESAYAIKTGKLYMLSEQHIVDCDTHSFGCDGGWPIPASFLLAISGTILRKDYPYKNNAGECRQDEFEKVFKL